MQRAEEAEAPAFYTGRRLVALGLLALLMLVPVTLPVAVLRELVHDRFGVSELLTSLFMSVNMVGAIIAAPIAGALGDRFGRRRPLIIASLVLDGILLWMLTLPLPFAVFMAIRFLEGAAHIFGFSLLLALAADSATPARRGRVMGMVGGGTTLGVALGAPLGGVIGQAGPLVPLQVGAALSIASALIAAWILAEPAQRSGRSTFRRIIRTIRRDKALLIPLAFAFADRFSVGFFTTTFSLYLTRVHELTSSQVGGLLFCFLLPFSLLSYPFGRLSERVSRTALVCGGSLLYGLGTMTLGWWPVEQLPLLMLGLGVLSAVMFVPSLVMTSDLADPDARATALGGFNAAGSLGFIIGPLTGGYVSQRVAAGHGWETGYTAAFATAGAAEVLVVLLALPVLLHLVRRGRTT